MENFGRIQRKKCLFHDSELEESLEQLLAILEARMQIRELEPCQTCLNNYDHEKLIHLHYSINTVYDALRMIQVELNQVRLSAENT